MFTLQIQCPTIEDAERIIAALKYSANPAVVEALAAQVNAEVEPAAITPEVEKPKNPRGRPRREVAEKPAASSAPATEADSGTETSPGVDTSAQQAPTLDDARAALKAVQAKYGTDDMSKPLEVLGQFSAGRISEVKPEQYPAFIAACKAA
jgi:predicted lipid-binding transport protein (Tim44 family)